MRRNAESQSPKTNTSFIPNFSLSGLPKILTTHTSPGILAALFLYCFLTALITGSLIIQPHPTQAAPSLTLVGNPTITMTSGSSSLELRPVPNINDGLASSQHTITTNTNVPTGYNLSLSTPTTPALQPTQGTITSPIALANNTWGYALASTNAVGVYNDFDASYASPTPSPNSKWANPSTNTIIKDTATAASNDQTTIYYAAKADINLRSGTYANTVRYTATANLTNIPAPTITSITPNSGTTAGGTNLVIVGTGFTANNQSITTSVTIGGATTACTNVVIYSNTPSIGKDTIYCTTPARATAGATDVVVATWKGVATNTNGYTYVKPADVTFVSPDQASTVAGTESGPVFTIVGTGFTDATHVTIGGVACASFQVVSDKHIFCKAPNTINTTGSKTIAVTKIVGTGTTNGKSTASVAYNSTAYPTLQASNAFAQCSATAKLFRDERDSQLYYVRKMPDEKCWMVDNLKYANYGTLLLGRGFLTADGTSRNDTDNLDVAKYVDLGAEAYCAGTNNMPVNTNTRCGLLYNWYAATNGTGTNTPYASSTNVAGSICPVNFRLPSIRSDANTATGNGGFSDKADFPVLDASMSAGTLASGAESAGYVAGWQPTGDWHGVFSGRWYTNGYSSQTGEEGTHWSSTAPSSVATPYPYYHFFNNNSASTGTGASGGIMYYGHAVRCVMENPIPTPPPGSNPSNISSTNPAVLDVYPTTGWAGDTIAITSNALFTNVTSVTVGGTACQTYAVTSPSVIACKLPSKTAGTSNEIAVISGGINITPAGTYTHMKVTYFNPNISTVSINGKSYNTYRASSFTGAMCSRLKVSNDSILSNPAASIAYIRDTRNNQAYKVKRMADGKCWMVDNLKYLNNNITFNNGDHRANGGSGAYNTVDESNAQSDANSNKAFWNNPMGDSYCYGLGGTMTNTLTHCGYLYNWYATTNGTGTYAQGAAGTNVTGSICPANFRLPSVTSNGVTATGDGTSFDAADFAVLNASMHVGTPAIGATTYTFYPGWQPSGAWGGTFSGGRGASFTSQGAYGFYWSSTVSSAAGAGNAFLTDGYAAPSDTQNKYNGLAVRCVAG